MFTTGDSYLDWHEELVRFHDEQQRRRLREVERMIASGRFQFSPEDQHMLRELGIDPDG